MGQALCFLPGKNGAGPAVSVPTQSRSQVTRSKAPRSFPEREPERGYHQDALIPQPLAKHLGLSRDNKAPLVMRSRPWRDKRRSAQGNVGNVRAVRAAKLTIFASYW